MTAYLIVNAAGDSNLGEAAFGDATRDVVGAGGRIWKLTLPSTIVVGDEPLSGNAGYGGSGPLSGGNALIGSTVALCRLIRDAGLLPTGYDILIVQNGNFGVSFAGGWASGGAACNTMIANCQTALGLQASNRFFFTDWNHGMNDGGETQAIKEAYLAGTHAALVAGVPQANGAPWLSAGVVPYRADVSNPGTYSAIDAAMQNTANVIPNSAYVDTRNPTSLPSGNNGGIHLSSAAHAGGQMNNSGAAGYISAWDMGHTVVTSSLAQRKFAALLTLARRKQTATW